MGASLLGILRPVKLLTLAHFAKIARKWANFQEPKKGEKFADAILDWSSRKTPFIRGFQCEACTSNTRCTLLFDISINVGVIVESSNLDTVCFVKNQTVEIYRMYHTCE